MYGNLLQSVSAHVESDMAKRVLFLLDFAVFPALGLILLFIVYRLVKSKKIIPDGDEKQHGN